MNVNELQRLLDQRYRRGEIGREVYDSALADLVIIARRNRH